MPAAKSWKELVQDSLEALYLGSDDPRWQSGFRGDAAAWRRAREVIIEAIHRDGTLLDVGCANGFLMECLAGWAAERGYRIEPYGLEILDSLAELARSRLPDWSDRIYTGDVRDWVPPFRFDFVRTHLDVAPLSEWRHMVGRLAEQLTTPGGRVICCSYGSSHGPDVTSPVGDLLRSWGYEVAGEAEARESNGAVVTRVAWIDVV